MYPFIRLAWQLWLHRNDPPLSPADTHVSHHLCLPWDLDGFMEMNNGRVLTLFDLGRFTSARRLGLLGAVRRKGWGLAVAGNSNRFRRRILPFARIEMRTRLVGWDARFFYILQDMWVNGECACQTLVRTAVTERGRSVPSERVLAELGWHDDMGIELPDWVEAWIGADTQRPWPPDA